MGVRVLAGSSRRKDAARASYACISMMLCLAFAQVDRSASILSGGSAKEKPPISDGSIGLLIVGAWTLTYAVLPIQFDLLSYRINRTRSMFDRAPSLIDSYNLGTGI